jgi:hypothetical protein
MKINHAMRAVGRIQRAFMATGQDPPPDSVLLPFIQEAIDGAVEDVMQMSSTAASSVSEEQVGIVREEMEK